MLTKNCPFSCTFTNDMLLTFLMCGYIRVKHYDKFDGVTDVFANCVPDYIYIVLLDKLSVRFVSCFHVHFYVVFQEIKQPPSHIEFDHFLNELNVMREVNETLSYLDLVL